MGQIMKNDRFLYLRLYIDTQIQARSASGFKRQEQHVQIVNNVGIRDTRTEFMNGSGIP